MCINGFKTSFGCFLKHSIAQLWYTLEPIHPSGHPSPSPPKPFSRFHLQHGPVIFQNIFFTNQSSIMSSSRSTLYAPNLCPRIKHFKSNPLDSSSRHSISKLYNPWSKNWSTWSDTNDEESSVQGEVSDRIMTSRVTPAWTPVYTTQLQHTAVFLVSSRGECGNKQKMEMSSLDSFRLSHLSHIGSKVAPELR